MSHIDHNKFYCEGDGQKPGIPEGWHISRLEWAEREKNLMLPGEPEALNIGLVLELEEDRKIVLEGGFHIAAAGYEGMLNTEPPEPKSAPDERGGVRIGLPGNPDLYSCRVCGLPVRMIR